MLKNGYLSFSCHFPRNTSKHVDLPRWRNFSALISIHLNACSLSPALRSLTLNLIQDLFTLKNEIGPSHVSLFSLKNFLCSSLEVSLLIASVTAKSLTSLPLPPLGTFTALILEYLKVDRHPDSIKHTVLDG